MSALTQSGSIPANTPCPMRAECDLHNCQTWRPQLHEHYCFKAHWMHLEKLDELSPPKRFRYCFTVEHGMRKQIEDVEDSNISDAYKKMKQMFPAAYIRVIKAVQI